MIDRTDEQLRFLDFFDRDLLRILSMTSKYLSVTSGRTPNIGKDSSPGISNSELHNAVTYMDRLVQDFIVMHITDQFPHINFLVEEDTASVDLAKSGDYVATVLIDPIDGTKAFVDGTDDYSTLVTVIMHGHVVRAAGIYPSRGVTIIAHEHGGRISGSDGCPQQLSVDAHAERTEKICCHYRLLKEENERFAKSLKKSGKTLEWNGHGFVTNLSAAAQVIRGNADAFVCPYTAAHDAIAPVFMIMAAGGEARRYNIASQWSDHQRMAFEFDDIEEASRRKPSGASPRMRLIAARSSNVLDEIECIFSYA